MKATEYAIMLHQLSPGKPYRVIIMLSRQPKVEFKAHILEVEKKRVYKCQAPNKPTDTI